MQENFWCKHLDEFDLQNVLAQEEYSTDKASSCLVATAEASAAVAKSRHVRPTLSFTLLILAAGAHAQRNPGLPQPFFIARLKHAPTKLPESLQDKTCRKKSEAPLKL